jgi:3-dehydrosphinganine reductase
LKEPKLAKNSHWQGKVALITGGSNGIGLAAAKILAASGAHVWLAARRIEILENAFKEVVGECLSSEQCCGYIPTDVSDPKQAAHAVEVVTASAGVPDVIINSAGITQPGYVQDLSLDVFEAMMKVNYFGTVYVNAAAMPAMIKRGSGHIMNISSMAGYLGVFGYSAYGASKFAVTGYSEVLRAEMKPCGLRVSVVFPPDTDTAQLAYETPFKPAETKAISGNAKALSAEKVAGDMLRQAAKGKYLIFPGTDSRLFYIATTKLPKGLVFAILDMMAASGRKSKSS